VLAGRIDRIQSGTTAMEKLFNLHAAESAREYVFHHPEDERYVPTDLHEPYLVNIKPMGGLVDMDFDGEPIFSPHGHDGQVLRSVAAWTDSCTRRDQYHQPDQSTSWWN